MRLPAALLVATALAAQTAPPATETKPEGPAGLPVYQNTGKAIKLPFACTDDDIHFAGLSCTPDEPCATYLELTGWEQVGDKLFTAGNIHTTETTLYSVFLSSADKGKTWREAHDRIRGAGLDQLQFLDFQHGWVGGSVLYPLPRDPFVLATADGGKSWSKYEIFGEARGGAILEMRFSSPKDGAVVLDRGQSEEGARYEMYETPTGGSSWLIREAGEKPMNIKRSAMANPDKRLRADANTKAFQLEVRQAGKWSSLSGFAIELDACKPAPPPDREPPPPPESEAAKPTSAPYVEELRLPPPGRRKPPAITR